MTLKEHRMQQSRSRRLKVGFLVFPQQAGRQRGQANQRRRCRQACWPGSPSWSPLSSKLKTPLSVPLARRHRGVGHLPPLFTRKPHLVPPGSEPDDQHLCSRAEAGRLRPSFKRRFRTCGTAAAERANAALKPGFVLLLVRLSSGSTMRTMHNCSANNLRWLRRQVTCPPPGLMCTSVTR